MSDDFNIYAETKPLETEIDLTAKQASSHVRLFMFTIEKENGEGITIDYAHLRYITHVKDYLLTLCVADVVITIEGKGLDILRFQLACRNANQINEGTTTEEGVTINKITINLPNLSR